MIKKETDLSNYALLHDRVAVADHIPQFYGTQGRCTGPGTWEPDATVGTIAELDKRRAEVGLRPMAEYIAGFKKICHQDVLPLQCFYLQPDIVQEKARTSEH